MTRYILIGLFLLDIAGPVQAAVTAWKPFNLESGYVAIPISIDGYETKALLNPGISNNMISTSFVEQHGGDFNKGGKMRVSGAYTSAELDLITKIPVEVFGMSITLDDVSVGDLGDVDFMFALEYFEAFVMQLDYPHMKMRLIERDSVDLKALKNVDFFRDKNSNQPVIKVNLSQKTDTWLILDIGNSGRVVLTRKLAKKYSWLDDQSIVTPISKGVNLTGENMQTFTLASFGIGPYELENVKAIVPMEGEAMIINKYEIRVTYDSRRSAGGSKHSHGMLGYNVLQHFLITVDFWKNRLHIGLPPERE